MILSASNTFSAILVGYKLTHQLQKYTHTKYNFVYKRKCALLPQNKLEQQAGST
jgi:hypothetical protein